MTVEAAAIPVARPDAPPGARPDGWWGMVLLIATEATLFAAARRDVLLPPVQDATAPGRRPASPTRRS